MSLLIHDGLAARSKEPPPNKNQDEQSQPSKRAILAQQQLPINPHRRPSILGTILPQPAAHLPHTLQTITPIQQIFNILRHDLGNIAQLVIQFIQVLRGARVRVCGFGARDEGVEFHEGVGSHGGREDLLQRVGGAEFGGEVREVGEGELAGVGALADAHVDYVLGDEVAGGLLVGGSWEG